MLTHPPQQSVMGPWTTEEIIVLIWSRERGVKKEAVRELIKHKCRIQRTLQSIAGETEDVCYAEERSIHPDLRLRGLGKQRLDESSTWTKSVTGDSRWIAGPVEKFLLRQLDDTESDTEILQTLVQFGTPEKAIATKMRFINVDFCSSWLLYWWQWQVMTNEQDSDLTVGQVALIEAHRKRYNRLFWRQS